MIDRLFGSFERAGTWLIIFVAIVAIGRGLWPKGYENVLLAKWRHEQQDCFKPGDTVVALHTWAVLTIVSTDCANGRAITYYDGNGREYTVRIASLWLLEPAK